VADTCRFIPSAIRLALRWAAARCSVFMQPPAKSVQHNRAVLMLLVANLFWGLSFPLIKALGLLQERLLLGIGPWFSGLCTVAPRFLLAALVLLIWQARDRRRISPGEFKQGIIIGLFAGMGMLFQNDGLQFTAASTSAFLTQFYAIMIPVYLAIKSRQSPRLSIWISCALVLAGVAILGRFDWQTLSFGRGEWETLLSSVFFMGQILWLEKKEFADNRPEKLTLVMFSTQAIMFCTLACILAPDTTALITPWFSPAWLALTAVLTVFSTLGAYIIMNTWQPKITATEAGLIYCIEPIFGSTMALFLPGLFSIWAGINYPNELATLNLLIGGGLITAANVIIQLNPPVRV
jgi:drug/metabolite transporter (DMT)-like permease